ncbi:MAG: hypothetical protein A2138_11805 [Deltaproteobacteria bacterium RBG_16_71_12]|nr:MAG: hypothetical protein A2138_11805 [Deltaproteobacteria bacterium RBG_16_71_12]
MALGGELARFIEGSGLLPDDVADVTAVLLLLGGAPPVDPIERAVVEEFFRRAELSGLSPDELGPRIAAHFAGRPSLSLVLNLGRLVREDLGATPTVEALGAVIGTSAGARSVLGGGVRPPGTVPAGPGARFSMPAKPARK